MSKDGAQSPKKLDMHDLARLMMWKQAKRTLKHVYPFTHVPNLIKIIAKMDDNRELLSHCDNKWTTHLGTSETGKTKNIQI